MSTRAFACRACRRILSRYFDDNGHVQFRHTLADLHHYDHQPQPTFADSIPGGAIYACDFCADDGAIIWNHTTSPVSMIADGDQGTLVTNYGTTWGACPTCAPAVQARDIDQLHSFACARAGIPRRSPAAQMSRNFLATIVTELQDGRVFLPNGLTGPPPHLLPKLLPRIRDRLAALLDPGNTLPTLGSHGDAQQCLANGLPMSRLYAIDATFTDMAIAAAASLHDTTLAALHVPAPFGLVLWTHPVDQHGSVAASWATDGDNVHIAFYRGLGTDLQGVQEQRLREQVGWLNPNLGLSLTRSDPLDADHSAAPLVTTFLLIAHRLAETTLVNVDQRVRQAYARAQRPAPEVRLVHLRPSARPSTAQHDATTGTSKTRREPDHRWWCAPFTRSQPCGPGRTDRTTVLVLPFINGPKGKPVRASTTVRLLAQPKTRPAQQNPGEQPNRDG